MQYNFTMRTDISKQEIEDIALGKFSLECTGMFLRQDREDDPKIYSGSGLIFQDNDCNLTFKLLSDKVRDTIRDTKDIIDQFNESLSGRIIPPERYYTLEAYDVYGRVWRASKILPSQTQGVGVVVSGKVYEIVCKSKPAIPYEGYFVRLRYPGRQHFPCNITTETCVKVGNKKVNECFSWNRARITTSIAEFEFYNDGDYFVAEAYSNNSVLPPQLEQRITDALEFVFGKPLRSIVSEVGIGDQLELTIRNRISRGSRGLSHPPLFHVHSYNNESYWHLFDLYLQHICKETDDRRHPLSRFVHSVIVSSESSIEARALTVGVAAEGILKAEYAGYGSPDETFISELEFLRELVEKQQFKSNLGKRIEGVLGNMASPSAEDRMKALIREGIIAEYHRAAWKRIRHSAAHADYLDPESLQKYLTLYYRVLTMIHLLVFEAIGYEGQYTDYGDVGWPVREYKKGVFLNKD